MANAAHKRPQNCFDRDEQLSVAVIHLRLEYRPPTVQVIYTYEVCPRKDGRGFETQPKLQPALWRLSAMISQYFIESSRRKLQANGQRGLSA